MEDNHDWYNVALKLFLKNNKGEVLGLKESPARTTSGFYDFPGGRLNDDEFAAPYEKIIQREVLEELGKNVKYNFNLNPVSFARHTYFSQRRNKNIRIFLIYFEAEYLGGKITISDEHTDHRWLNLQQIKLEDFFTSCSLEAVKRYLEFHG